MTSLEQRREIQKLANAGKTAKQIAKALGISAWTAKKWSSRLKKGAHSIRKWGDPS